jgi:hypothetical protein
MIHSILNGFLYEYLWHDKTMALANQNISVSRSSIDKSEVKVLYDSDLNFKMDSQEVWVQFKWNDDNFQTDNPHLCVNEYFKIEIEVDIRWQSWSQMARCRGGPL